MSVVAVTASVFVIVTVTPIPIVVVVPTSHPSESRYLQTQTRFAWQGLLLNGSGSWKAEVRELYCMSAARGWKRPRVQVNLDHISWCIFNKLRDES